MQRYGGTVTPWVMMPTGRDAPGRAALSELGWAIAAIRCVGELLDRRLGGVCERQLLQVAVEQLVRAERALQHTRRWLDG